jgi:allantoinase
MTTALPYPRDLRGYGRVIPHARWPGGARIAVQFVLNYEEGGENNPLHGDAGSGDLPVRAGHPQAYENRHMTHGVACTSTARAPASGASCASSSRGLPLTVFRRRRRRSSATPSCCSASWSAATRSPATACAGSTTRTCPRPPSAAHGARHAACMKELTGGQWPAGWYTGRDSPNTRRLVVDQGGYEYDSDYYGDDLPFWLQVKKTDGTRGAAPGGAVHAGLQRHALRAGRRASTPATTSSSTCATPSTRCTPKATPPGPAEDDEHRHALPAARQARAHRLAAALPGPHPAKHDRVWICRRIDIARHWKQVHPFDAATAFVWTSGSDTMLTLDRLNAATQAEFTPCSTAPTSTRRGSPRPPGRSGRSLAGRAEAGAGAGAARRRSRPPGGADPRPPGAGRQGDGQQDADRRIDQRAGQGRPDRLHAGRVRAIQRLNADYNAKFGWPFILAVRGPRGSGAAQARDHRHLRTPAGQPPRLRARRGLRNIHRIAEIRLNDKFGTSPELGNQVWDWAEALAAHSDPGYKPSRAS